MKVQIRDINNNDQEIEHENIKVKYKDGAIELIEVKQILDGWYYHNNTNKWIKETTTEEITRQVIDVQRIKIMRINTVDIIRNGERV